MNSFLTINNKLAGPPGVVRRELQQITRQFSELGTLTLQKVYMSVNLQSLEVLIKLCLAIGLVEVRTAAGEV
jgi:hypothetical protein